MDAEKVILISGLGFVIAVAAFVFFGPSTRPRRRTGQICGLVNFGKTCFLNSLLQALASCPVIVDWLSHYVSEKNSFIKALHTAVLVLNGQHTEIFEDPYTPEDVIKCLYNKGWTISPEEHDVHELLNVVMTTIEEEIHHSGPSKISSLADLPYVVAEQKDVCQQNVSNEQKDGLFRFSHCEKENSVDMPIYPKTSSTQEVAGLTRSDAPCSLGAAETEPHDDVVQFNNKLNSFSKECNLNNGVRHVEPDMSHVVSEDQLSDLSRCSEEGSVRDWKNRDMLSQQLMSAAGIVRYIQSDIRKIPLPGVKGSSMWTVPPCEGLLAGQTVCTRCKYKSPVKYDKFGCISLTLPPGETLYPKITLHQLLGKFFSPELITGVSCETCEKVCGSSKTLTSSIFKTYNLGKLPPCLIFHIQRTTWQSSGVSKRHDYIEFPEILSMHAYLYGQIQKRPNDLTFTTKGESSSRKASVVIDRFKHLYRLSAVIVHKGDVEHGHFVTYRRSPVHPNSWYYISDSDVLESSLNEVLQTSAYMLFYSRCQAN